MKPVLVVGLGNSLMGDDGVGVRVAERLLVDPRLPDDVDVIAGGTDLLRFSGEMEGRQWVFVIDAIEDGRPPGSIHIFDEALPGGAASPHSHHLSAVGAIELLRRFVNPRIVFIAVSISSAAGGELSAAVAECLPAIVDAVQASIADSHVL